MTHKFKGAEKATALDLFTRGLMATTCLTVACGASAVAGTITLTFDGQPSSPGTLLPTGTNVVNGFVGSLPDEGGTSNVDWFEFQGLSTTDTYTLTAQYNPLGPRGVSGNGENGLRASLFNNSAVPYYTGLSLEGQSGVNVELVPADGFLEVEISTNFVESGRGSYYQVTLTDDTTSTPEPGTAATVGLALAGALAWSRKRRQ